MNDSVKKVNHVAETVPVSQAFPCSGNLGTRCGEEAQKTAARPFPGRGCHKNPIVGG
jgi:hypothetical protein